MEMFNDGYNVGYICPVCGAVLTSEDEICECEMGCDDEL